MENPIIRLGELTQRYYGKNIETEVIGQTGPDHCPEIKVRITMPNGEYEEATGSNKKVAKQKAAERLLKRFQDILFDRE
ncbi:putative dsRNA-binding protein [Prevotella intermedia]|uniref:DRBM domain-containing protein n=1 Tax=Prevotella intermedia TaxID=28131 RepID=A0A2M8TPT9_PREIN|nr:double-stranded RNA binding motif domain-containing protein [Prevotella intermedia]PJI25948.1 hypothetical protein CTM58_13030 [Prevotella intermedia]